MRPNQNWIYLLVLVVSFVLSACGGNTGGGDENTTVSNHPPVATVQSITTDEDIAKAITLTGTDEDNNTLAYTVTNAPTHGTLGGTAPNVTYTPAADYNGADSFKFKVNDGTDDSAEATVSITVTERPFRIKIKTNTPGGGTPNDQFMISVNTLAAGLVYDYRVDCNDDGTDEATGQTGDYTCKYSTLGGAGEYTIAIRGRFPAIYMGAIGNDARKLLSIEEWGTQKWKTFYWAFLGCSNMALGATDIPNLSVVTDMSSMFNGAATLNQNINNWDTAHVTNMNGVFAGTTVFNQDISGWDTANVTNMQFMFLGASAFDQDIGSWNTAKVLSMVGMFQSATAFNQDIGNWDTAHVTDMAGMFLNAKAFDQDIGGWDTARVTDMQQMFYGATAFDQDISNWDTASSTTMNAMFYGAAKFDHDISGWNTAQVTDMYCMFREAAKFDQDISGWNTASVTDMDHMFFNAKAFNQNIGGWNTASVTDMRYMFSGAIAFDQDLSSWHTYYVTNMAHMFHFAFAFANHDLSSWVVTNVTDHTDFLTGSGGGNTAPGGW